MARTASKADSASDLAALSYEQAREELVEVVRTLEAGTVTLEQSLALWERGEALAARCQAWLDGAREKLDAAVAQDRGASSPDEDDEDDEDGEEPGDDEASDGYPDGG